MVYTVAGSSNGHPVHGHAVVYTVARSLKGRHSSTADPEQPARAVRLPVPERKLARESVWSKLPVSSRHATIESFSGISFCYNNCCGLVIRSHSLSFLTFLLTVEAPGALNTNKNAAIAGLLASLLALAP